MKFANLPKKIPIGATNDTKSIYKKGSCLCFFANIMLEIITPIKPPWKDIPPSQILKISRILLI